MSAPVFAPWGELVPHEGLLTDDDLLALPDDGKMYELMEGRLLRMSPSGGTATLLGVKLSSILYAFVSPHGLGAISGADGEYVLSKPGAPVTALAPDIGFVRADRVPPRDSPIHDKAWPLAPDLAVEVASPNQYRPGMATKAQVYLSSGVRLVWVVWPKRREVDIWHPGDTKPSRTLRMGDALDGEDVLPGFSYSLDQLFA
ncbi:MAG TPA: Uma2 family endonuclease [Chloroflexota bacterium]|jgi:Uma2 family endonuclease|nr:Uma2 family endonuclease [Chloroflexota bacterium]